MRKQGSSETFLLPTLRHSFEGVTKGLISVPGLLCRGPEVGLSLTLLSLAPG
jgi:hypothetical protein